MVPKRQRHRHPRFRQTVPVTTHRASAGILTLDSCSALETSSVVLRRHGARPVTGRVSDNVGRLESLSGSVTHQARRMPSRQYPDRFHHDRAAEEPGEGPYSPGAFGPGSATPSSDLLSGEAELPVLLRAGTPCRGGNP